MIKNGSFEGSWTTPVPHQQWPEHWHFGFTDGQEAGGDWFTTHPELRVWPREQIPENERDLFLLDGDNCLKLFKAYGAIHCWLQQAVELKRGNYRLVVPAFVDTFMWDNGKQPPLPNTKPEDRAARIRLYTKDQNDIRIYSQWYDENNVPDFYNYEGYHYFVHDFDATTERMTIGFEVWNPWPLDNNGWVFDAIKLEGDMPDECRGKPREQYKRIYNVIPADASEEEAVEIFRERWRASRETVGGSYDDAGIGDLDNRVARLWGLPDTAHSEYVDWYETHYPEVDVEFASLGGTTWDNYLLAQGDPRWGDHVYADGNCYTLRAQGCFITCCAMAQRLLGIDLQATPLKIDQTLGAGGYDGCYLKHSAMRDKLGLDISYASGTESAVRHLEQGGVVFVEVEPSSLMHFVVAVEYDDDFLVLDPWKNRVARLKDLYDGAESFRLITKKNTDQLGPTISFHVQAGADGLMEYIANVKPSVVKLCHQSGMAADVHRASPDTLIVYRKVQDNWHDIIYSPDLLEAAADFIDWMRPELEELERALGGDTFAVEGLNETIACGAVEDIRRVVEFESNFAYLLVENEFSAVPVVLNTAVGNPEHGAEEEMLVPAARAAVETDGYVGYHPYSPVIGDKSWLESDWEHYAGRWTEWDKVFRGHGLRPKYVMTESGPIGGTNIGGVPYLTGDAGWRSPRCLDGDWNRTIAEILRCDQLSHASVPGQEGRYIGQCLFTVGDVGWKYFQYKRDQFESLANAILV